MGKAWLAARWKVLLPQLQRLGVTEEEEIARLCEAEVGFWRSRPEYTKLSSLKTDVTNTRNMIRKIPVTPANRWKNPRSGKYEHIALKYLNLSKEEWDQINAGSRENFEERLSHQQLIDHPETVLERAEALLHSMRWDDLVTGLALCTGRRLAELLKSGRFFPKSLHTVLFDGQLKRRDLDLLPYEIPVLADAEQVLAAWRRLRALQDCSELSIEEVEARFSRPANQNANRCFSGLIPEREGKNDLCTHAFRGVYARLAVWLYCPVRVKDLIYANTILGHYQAVNEQKQRDFLTTVRYFDYAIGDGQGQIDGRQGLQLGAPGVEVIAAFQQGDQEMTTTQSTDAEPQQPGLETKKHKTRGTFTVRVGTYDTGVKLMQDRGFEGTGGHDRLIVDLMAHDAVAHQIYGLVQPLTDELGADGPVSAVQALIAAYHEGGAHVPGLADLLQEVADEGDPVVYLRKLVERDHKFQQAIADRGANVDYTQVPMADLRRKYRTLEAAQERYRRAVDAVIVHNESQGDPLHLWYINAPLVKELVGGRLDFIQNYLATRQAEINEHHKRFSLTSKQNRKPVSVVDEITVE